MVPFSFEKKNSAIKESGKSFDRYVNVCEDINKFRLNGGFKINGDSEPFLNHEFPTLGFFNSKIPESENGGLEPTVSLKPQFNGKLCHLCELMLDYL